MNTSGIRNLVELRSGFIGFFKLKIVQKIVKLKIWKKNADNGDDSNG